MRGYNRSNKKLKIVFIAVEKKKERNKHLSEVINNMIERFLWLKTCTLFQKQQKLNTSIHSFLFSCLHKNICSKLHI